MNPPIATGRHFVAGDLPAVAECGDALLVSTLGLADFSIPRRQPAVRRAYLR